MSNIEQAFAQAKFEQATEQGIAAAVVFRPASCDNEIFVFIAGELVSVQ